MNDKLLIIGAFPPKNKKGLWRCIKVMSNSYEL